tara:strand:- start:1769 stop:1906 length:138 start_codon:yes stop_codon:yes gene_type:complete
VREGVGEALNSAASIESGDGVLLFETGTKVDGGEDVDVHKPSGLC